MYCSRCNKKEGKKQVKKEAKRENESKSHFAKELERNIKTIVNLSRGTDVDFDESFVCSSCEEELEVLKKIFNE